MSLPVQTYLPQPSRPRLALPAGACDAHCHVIGPARDYPLADGGYAVPTDAPKEKLFALHRHLGIERCVVVQSSAHGFDNRVVEDTLRAGERRYLGVALTPVTTADAELARLARAGFRGVRFNFMAHLRNSASPADVIDFSRRLAPFGMHLQIHFASERVHELAPVLRRSAVPVVIDHMGRVDAAKGPDHADFAALHHLLRDPRFLVKIAGVDRVSPPGDYATGAALARLLVRDYPDRCLWGTDWPHPNHHHVPDDGVLVDLLADIAPGDALERLMVRNPMAFYRFDA